MCRSHYLGMILLPLLLAACASTTVKKNPGPHDHGIRYYRPKPYLLIQPTLEKGDEQVSVSLQYLPDFGEEYSIHIRAGIGKNKTGVELKDGWNLTKIDVDIDSQTDENITALGKLLEGAGKVFTPTSGNAGAAVVKATNVPIGYYEAVVSQGSDGRKRLYGWRYVGFAPFATCPIESDGVECQPCSEAAVFALVFELGVMTFKPITAAVQGNPDRTVVKPPGLIPVGMGAAQFERVKVAVLNATKPVLEKQMGFNPGDLSASDFTVSYEEPRRFVVTVKLVGETLGKVLTITSPERLSEVISPIIGDTIGDRSFSGRVELVEKPVAKKP